jgi:DNA-binding transcriptional ArsR family regulator
MALSNSEVDPIFEALADWRRRSLLVLLAQMGPASATKLQKHSRGITRQGVAKHMLILAGAGLVERQRRGRYVDYRVTPAALFDALSWLSVVGADVARAEAGTDALSVP